MFTNFVNPYTFVDTPAGVRRSIPSGHNVASDASEAPLLSGAFTVSWTLRTPFLLPSCARDEGRFANGRLRIPGSSIKGAIRSLHETMFNGCLRVLDEEFVPGYRDVASTRAGDISEWTLAIVAKDEAGTPREFQLCEDVVWIDAHLLLDGYKRFLGEPNRPSHRLPRTGDRLTIDADIVGTKLSRDEFSGRIDELCWAAPDGSDRGWERVVLVTNTTARKAMTFRGGKARCLWATALVTDRRIELLPESLAVAAFRAAAAGCDDRRDLEGKNPQGEWRSQRQFAAVNWPPPRGRENSGSPIGTRTLQSGFLFRGDVVWVRLRGQEVAEIKLSRLWRHPGKHSVGERLGPVTPTSAHPCQPTLERNQLCLSCQIFGAANTTGGDRSRGSEQSSYAGHVRFGAAVTPQGATIEVREIPLTPMGAPKPGSGGFYLKLGSAPARNMRLDEIPARWGSAQDEAGRRHGAPIRGRKYYWHTDPDKQAEFWSRDRGRVVEPRYVATSEQQRSTEMTRRAYLVPAGTVVTAQIAVDGLTRDAFESLLAALDPARLLLAGDQAGPVSAVYAVHLGGGKPLGLGSAVPHLDLDGIHVTSIAERYTRTTPERISFSPTMPADVRSRLTERVGPIDDNIESLRRVLNVAGTGTDEVLVSYPPGADWTEVGTQRFRESFRFFQEANGQHLKRGDRPWRPLPSLDADAQSIPVTLPGRRESR